MKIINNVAIATVSTLFITLGSQSAFSSKIPHDVQEKENNQVAQVNTKDLARKSSAMLYSKQVMPITDSWLSLPAPEPLTILCVLAMAGCSGFFKLKIAQAKFEQKTEEG